MKKQKFKLIIKCFCIPFLIFLLLPPVNGREDTNKKRAEFFAEIGLKYSNNIFGLTEAQQQKLEANSAEDTNRFDDMESVSDLVYSPKIGLKYNLSKSKSRELKFSGYLQYNFYSDNSRSEHPEAGFSLKKNLGKKDKLEFKGEFIIDKFKKNYLCGVNDANANGNIPKSERIYSAATYNDYQGILSYEHVLNKNKNKHMTKSTLQPYLGYRKREYNPMFSNRDYTLPFVGMEYKMDFKPGFDLEIGYEYGELDSDAGQELFLYDETISGVDISGDGNIKANAPLLSTVDRSSERKTWSVGSSLKCSKVTTFSLKFSNRTENYITNNTLDIKRYNQEGFERKFKAGLKFKLPGDWSSELEFTREHNKDGDDDESKENLYLVTIKRKI